MRCCQFGSNREGRVFINVPRSCTLFLSAIFTMSRRALSAVRTGKCSATLAASRELSKGPMDLPGALPSSRYCIYGNCDADRFRRRPDVIEQRVSPVPQQKHSTRCSRTGPGARMDPQHGLRTSLMASFIKPTVRNAGNNKDGISRSGILLERIRGRRDLYKIHLRSRD